MAFTLKDNLSFTGTGTNSSVHLNNVANGDTSFVAVCVNQGSTNQLTSVTDSKGNTYTRAGSYAGTSNEVELWYALNATLDTGTTVTVTPSNGAFVWGAVWAVFSGVATSNAFDKTAGNNGNGTTADSGNAATTSNTNDLIIGAFGQANNRPYNTGTGFSNINQAANGTSAECFMEYKTVSATGAYNATATFDITSNWSAGVFSFADTPIVTTPVGFYPPIEQPYPDKSFMVAY